MSAPSIAPTPVQDDPPIDLPVVEPTPEEATTAQAESNPSLVADSESNSNPKISEETTSGNTHTDATSLHTSETRPSEKNISTQPATTPNLSIAEAAPTKEVRDRLATRPSGVRRLRAALCGIGEGLYNILLFCRIVLFYWIPGTIFLLILSAAMVGLTLGLVAADGAICFLAGNGILRAAGLSHYTSNASAAAIGATGALFAWLCIVALTLIALTCLQVPRPLPWYVALPLSVFTMTLAGAIGTSLLHRHHVDIGAIDVLHGARAGALGGAILNLAEHFLGPAIRAMVEAVLAPLRLAMTLGFGWMCGGSLDTWSDHSYRSSCCYTYGSCGDETENEAEVEV